MQLEDGSRLVVFYLLQWPSSSAATWNVLYSERYTMCVCVKTGFLQANMHKHVFFRIQCLWDRV